MGIAFLAPELAKWDALGEAEAPPELLVLPFFSDERPLRGAAGLADWRLCGRLSRLLLARRVSGERGETTLLPARRLAFPRVVLFGLGAAAAFDEPRFRDAARGIDRVARDLAVARFALSLPGRATGKLVARRALELWLEESTSDGDVWIIEPPSAQKEAADLLARRAR